MRPSTRLRRAAAAAVAGLALPVLAGPGPVTVAWALLVLAHSQLRRGGMLTTLSRGLALLAPATLATGTAPALLAASAVTGALGAPPGLRASTFLAPLLLLGIWSGPVSGILPLLAGLLPAALPRLRALRYPAAAVGATVMLLLSGLPAAPSGPARHLEERLEGERPLWPETTAVNLASPSLRLEMPGMEGVDVRIMMTAGGVRDDTEPLGRVVSGSDTIPVQAGRGAVLVVDASGPVTVLLDREWSPFNHPVIWVGPADAAEGGE